jgi:two-component system nitrogen regulation sensor histidine kinase NtrY
MPLLSDANRRKRNLIIVAGFLVLVGAANFLDVGVYAPDLPLSSSIRRLRLLNLNLIVLLLLVLLLFRNLVKLWFERREQVIGAKFKAKLVMAFLSLSVIPSMLIFLIASNFITKSIEGWFKPQVEKPLDQALAVAQTYYANLERTALRHAQHIGRVIDRDGLLAEPRREALAAYLVEQQDRLGISAITVFGAHGPGAGPREDPILGDLATQDVDENQLRQGIAGQELTTGARARLRRPRRGGGADLGDQGRRAPAWSAWSSWARTSPIASRRGCAPSRSHSASSSSSSS